MADAVPVEEAEAPVAEIHPAEGAANPPEAGYLRVWWLDDKSSLNFLDVPAYPDLTFRELRVMLAEHTEFPLLGFSLGDLDGVLYPLDDHPEEGEKIICHVGPSGAGTTFGPYLGNDDIKWLRIADCLIPASVLGTLHVLTSSWLETICFRRIASARSGRPPLPTTLAHRMWVSEGPGAFWRCVGPAIVHYLFTAVVTQFPKAFLLGPQPPFWPAVFFRAIPGLFFLGAVPLHRAIASPMPRASFLSQFFYTPSFSLETFKRDLANFAPLTMTREVLGSMMEESIEEHQWLGKWLTKRGIAPSSISARLGLIVAKVLLLSPLYVAERYGLFCEPDQSFVRAFHALHSRGLLFAFLADGLVTELTWTFFAQRILGDIPLKVVMSRINQLARRLEDPALVRRLAVESVMTCAATVSFFTFGSLWFGRRQLS